jgi:hypothetical protein
VTETAPYSLSKKFAIHSKHNCNSPQRIEGQIGKQKRCHFCRSPRRGANSILRIGVSENDIIFCNFNFKEIGIAKNDIVFAYRFVPSILRIGGAVNCNFCNSILLQITATPIRRIEGTIIAARRGGALIQFEELE